MTATAPPPSVPAEAAEERPPTRRAPPPDDDPPAGNAAKSPTGTPRGGDRRKITHYQIGMGLLRHSSVLWLILAGSLIGCRRQPERISGVFGNVELDGDFVSYSTLSGLRNGDWVILYPGKQRDLEYKIEGNGLLITLKSGEKDDEFFLSGAGTWILSRPPKLLE